MAFPWAAVIASMNINRVLQERRRRDEDDRRKERQKQQEEKNLNK